MKELSFKLYVTNALELISGLDLIGDVDLKFSGLKLVAGKGVKMPLVPTSVRGKLTGAKLANLFEDTFMLDDLDTDILLSAPEGILFIGKSDKVMELANYMKIGKTGLAAASIDVDGYPRGFWSTNDLSVITKVQLFLLEGPGAPDDGDKPVEEPEKPAEKPAEGPAKPAKKPTKKGSKPKKSDAKPAEKPAEESAPEIPEEPEKPAEAEEAPAEKPAEGDKPVESECPCGSLSLEQLFLMTAPPRTDDEGDAAEAADADAVEETAEETCRRLCAEEGIAYDI